MAANNYLSSIPKLHGRENYEEWCFAMENFLILEGLNKCIEGTETDSVQIAKCKAKIVLAVDPSLYVHVKGAASAKDVWDKLKNLYENTGFSRKIGLLRTLISLRLENCATMDEYVNSVIETSQKLNRTGLKLDSELVGSLMLAGLPENFAPMVMALEHSGIKIDEDSIKMKLIDMLPDGSKFMSSTSSTSAFIGGAGSAHKRKPQKLNKNKCKKESDEIKKRDLSEIICYRCKKSGHFSSKCPQNQKSGKDNQKDDTKTAFNVVFLSAQYKNDEWYLDSGASMHLTCRKDWLLNKRTSNLKEIVVANSSRLPVQNSGEIDLLCRVNTEINEIEIRNAQYVPGLTTNLLSVSQLLENGNNVIFEKHCCKIYNNKKRLVAEAFLKSGVYKIDTVCPKPVFVGQVTSGEVWHKRLGHINSMYLNKMKNGLVDGINYHGQLKIEKQNCVVCCEGKQSRQPFCHKGTRATEILEVIHSDLAGPMETTSIGGSKYFLTFQDDYSRMSFVYFLKTKDETFEKFKEFQCLTEKQLDRKVKILRTDNGGEYINAEFEKYLKKQGIIHQTTNPYTPEQNGLSERLNRTIIEKARCLLYEANLEKKFWAEAVNTACYLRNRSMVSGLEKTPYEIFYKKKPNLEHIRIFGSVVMTHVPKEKRAKWDKKSEQLVLVGFSETTKGYRLYNPRTNKVCTSRDVHVMEKTVSETDVQIIGDINQDKLDTEELNTSTASQSEVESETLDDGDSSYAPDEDVSANEDVLRRSQRQRKAKTWDDFVTYFTEKTEESDSVGDPTSVKEALSSVNRDQWISAMTNEMNNFSENCAWDIVELPEGHTPVKCKWVFKTKLNSDNSITYRARLVAKGFSQRQGIDFYETFSPVVKHSTLRLLFALSVKYDFDIVHLDVVTAFLNGKLEEEVFMEIPEYFDSKFRNDHRNVLKLNRAIYGLKQSARVWYKEVETVLLVLNYKKCDSEPCLFIKHADSSITIIAVYVDDFFIFSNSNDEIIFVKEHLSKNFKIKDLGQVKQCLGMRVRINENKSEILLDQEQYISQVLERFNMNDCKSVSTPMVKNVSLDKTNSEDCQSELPYQQLLGSLMYISVLTRPDITFAVNYLSQFNNCFTEEHWKSAKRILRYLQGTKGYSLAFKRDNSKLIGYVDADFANDPIDRRSYTGFVFKMSGGAVSWECNKQKTVALSSTEAEYMAITEASKEAIHLRSLLLEIIGEKLCIDVFNDSQSAQKIALNPISHKRTKHIDVRHHFIREVISKNYIKLRYLSTDEMLADILTKSLCSVKHCKFVAELGLESVS